MSWMPPTPLCKDCVKEGVLTRRKLATDKNGAPVPGPRCVTHHRAQKKHRSTQEHERRIKANFGITEEQYQKIYHAQGGKCFICQRATGRTKSLAVDHDHKKCSHHDPKQGCPECIRALLCGPCNQLVARYDVIALHRAITVLTDPPARKALDER